MAGKEREEDAETALHPLDEWFPDIKDLLSFVPKSLGEIKDDCLVAFDASALLVPLEVDNVAFKEIDRILSSLAKSQRVVVAGQALREYFSNKPRKIRELVSFIDKSALMPAKMLAKRLGVLGQGESIDRAIAHCLDIDAKSKDLRREVDGIKESFRLPNLDSITCLYRENFLNSVVEINYTEEGGRDEFIKAARKRLSSKRPPGYKDKGLGDLIIWKTLLQVAKTRQTHMIFVTKEEKPDWVDGIATGTLHPRLELIDEYRIASSGKTLHICNLSTLLALFEATEDAVEEVERAESADEKQKDPFEGISTVEDLNNISEIVRGKTQRIAEMQTLAFRLFGDVNQSPSLPWNKQAYGLLAQAEEERKERDLLLEKWESLRR